MKTLLPRAAARVRRLTSPTAGWARLAALAPTAIWLALMLLAGLAAWQARYTADLSAFLPVTPTARERLLVDQLREGLASRVITAQISGADGATRARLSAALAAQLTRDGRFAAVENGDAAAAAADQRFLMEHRYLLSDSVTPARFGVAGLREAVGDTLDLLASPAGLLAKGLLVRDPTGEMIRIIDQMSGTGAPRKVAGVWSTRDGAHALLIGETRAQGSDTDGQEEAVEAMRSAFEAARTSLPPAAAQQVTLTLTGPPVFAVEARARIKGEVIRLTGLSTALVMILLLLVYRSVPALALGLTPVVSGALAGIAAVSVGFGVVHGITLGFGITLIGEAVDYSIYLLVQARQRSRGADWQRSMWPTVRLGMLTSVVGFASLVPSGFPGLAQLGLYSIAGLLAGAAVTRFVLPAWLPSRLAIRDLTPLGERLVRLQPQLALLSPWLTLLPLVACAALLTHGGPLFSRELSSLSPVPQAEQDLDGQLHADLGAPDAGYLVALEGPDRESVLTAAERAGSRLTQLSDSGVIGGFTSPASYLPSRATQEARRASLPAAPELRARLREALAGVPLEPERLAPFIADVEAARHAPLVSAQDLAATSLGAATAALLFESGGRWHALLPLAAAPGRKPGGADAGGIDVARVQRALDEVPGAPVVLGVKAEADQLYAAYVREAVGYSLAGAFAIVVLLAVALRRPGRVLRVVLPLALAVLTVAAGLTLAGRQLTILHIIGMLLIVAVGSNYALFFDKRAGEAPQPLTLASLAVANLATVLTFGVLAFASVPVLSALGQTVAPGALLALLFSAMLARPGLPESAATACPAPLT